MKKTAKQDSNAGQALRSLQKLDHVTKLRYDDVARPLLLDAMTKLGAALDLRCTGEDEGDGNYDHGAGTCPIHEWLAEGDYEEAEALRP